jgi:hypothetical protein
LVASARRDQDSPGTDCLSVGQAHNEPRLDAQDLIID